MEVLLVKSALMLQRYREEKVINLKCNVCVCVFFMTYNLNNNHRICSNPYITTKQLQILILNDKD